MKLLVAILCIHSFISIHSSGQYLPSASHFIKLKNVSEAMELCVFAVHTLEIKSLIECATRCGMNVLCNAFDFCFLHGLYTCRFFFGQANFSNTTTQCELFEITDNKDCPEGVFLRCQGTFNNNINGCNGEPCLNGATCKNTPCSFNCTCTAGWTGKTCDEDINECLDNPCQNGGNCTNNNGSFTCTCTGVWTGLLCTQVLPNIALGKPADQSSTYLSYGAQYAVDGIRETINDDKWTLTASNDTNPWWMVDLQAVYSIRTVRILSGDNSDLLRDVNVTVGLTKSDVNTPCGFSAGTLSELVVINCPTLPRGRFVNISKTTRYLSLCEVDVFGVSI